MQLEIFRSVLLNGWKSRKAAHQHSIWNVVGEKNLKVNKIVIIQLHVFCIWKFHMPYDNSKQTETVQSGRGQDKAKVPRQFLGSSLWDLKPCKPHGALCLGVKFSDVGRNLWTSLLPSWNQIRFQTKLIKSRAVKLTPTLGIPWHCLSVKEKLMHLSAGEKAVFSSVAPDHKLLSWRYWWSRPWWCFFFGRNRSPCSIQCLPYGQPLRKKMQNPTSLQRNNRRKW